MEQNKTDRYNEGNNDFEGFSAYKEYKLIQ